MDKETIIESSTQELKHQLEKMFTELPQGGLTPEKVAQFTQGMQQAISSAALCGYEKFITAHEHQEEKIIAGGQILRYKQDSKKKC